MSTEAKKSLLTQVLNERAESKRKAFKTRAKELIDEMDKAKEVLAGIQDKIVEEAASAGLTEEEIQDFFSSYE